MIKFKEIKKDEKGVVSLEACIFVPLFAFIMMFFYGLIVMFSGEQTMKHSLIQSAESLSLDSYAIEKIERKSFSDVITGDERPGIEDIILSLYGAISGNKGDADYFSSGKKWYSEKKDTMLVETVKKRFLGYIAGSTSDVEEKADDVLKTIRVSGGIDGLDFSGTTVEDGTLTIVLKYKQKFFIDLGGMAEFDRELKISIDMWGLK